MSEPKPSRPPLLRLRVTAAAEKAVRSGHPWLFASSIREQSRDGTLGELGVIYDRHNRFLAVGLFDPESPLRLRVLHAGKPATLDDAWWRERLMQAVRKRETWFAATTTGYRILHGESDGWPGLVLDRYDTTLVLKLYTAAWFPRLDDVVRHILDTLAPQRLVLRLSRNIQSVAKETFGHADGEILFGPSLSEPVVFLENGLRFEADVISGQKTGFFLDQRENRAFVESLAQGRAVLNAFSFSGGFSLYAARGGARSVTDIDLSQHALDSAGRNFALNQSVANVRQCAHESIQANAFDWLADAREQKFDLLIVDPPSLAKRQDEHDRALQAYGHLATNAIRLLRTGGILVAASCSAHVKADEFFDKIRQCARQSTRPFTELRTTRHPADHPASFPEAEYLKAIYLRIS
ncbi:MAG: class I SAM-dependent methyltransferase [Verrucomicrobiota bacterium]